MDALVASCGDFINRRAVQTRGGAGGVNQGMNINSGKQQSRLNASNTYWNSKLERVAISGVKQLGNRGYFRRGNRWIDGRQAANAAAENARVIEYGTREHLELVRDFAHQNRQSELSLRGEIVIEWKSEIVLVKHPEENER